MTPTPPDCRCVCPEHEVLNHSVYQNEDGSALARLTVRCEACRSAATFERLWIPVLGWEDWNTVVHMAGSPREPPSATGEIATCQTRVETSQA